jgi:hypothetical protein
MKMLSLFYIGPSLFFSLCMCMCFTAFGYIFEINNKQQMNKTGLAYPINYQDANICYW